MNGWMDGWMDRWMDGWMDFSMCVPVYVFISLSRKAIKITNMNGNKNVNKGKISIYHWFSDGKDNLNRIRHSFFHLGSPRGKTNRKP